MATAQPKPNGFPGHIPRENHEKVLLVGEPLCGKTVLWNCLKSGTIKPDVFKSPYLDVMLANGNQVCLGIVEAPCQPDYSTIRSAEYDDAKAVLLCFNLTEAKTLTSLEETWYPEVRQNNLNVPVFLIGLKWENDGEVSVLPEQAEAVAGKINAVKYFICTSENIEAVVPVVLTAVAKAVIETPSVAANI